MKLSDKTLKAFEALVPVITGTRRALITVHRDPDTDAIGSALAWAGFLSQRGIECTIWAADPLEPYLKWLPGVERVQTDFDASVDYDSIWFLDCASIERVRQYERLLPWVGKRPIINIDHHADNSLFGDHIVVETISSVGEFLVAIAEILNFQITREIATCLYAAISFDTGRFLYSNTTAQTFDAAATLVRTGISPGELGTQMFESVPAAGFEVLNLALSRMVIEPERRLVYTSLPKGTGPESIKVVDFVRQLEGADVVVVFREQDDGIVRVNLRSKGDVVVNTVAHFFGGGGHEKAAGITLPGPLDIVMVSVLARLRETLDAR
jgi:phosphoesterase RecJ-like protein